MTTLERLKAAVPAADQYQVLRPHLLVTSDPDLARPAVRGGVR